MNKFFPSDAFRYCPYCGADAFRPAGEEDYLQCGHCRKKFYINAAGAVTCIIVNPQDEILLVRRHFEPSKGMLDLPGGFVNIDETAEDAVRREIREELNLSVDAVRYLGSANNQYQYGGMLYFTLDLGFACSVSDFSSITASDDVDKYLFLAPEKVDFAQIAFPSVRTILKNFIGAICS
jgi:8-oxo-dGTP pyrophosphatase MutT (NUDIX family)